MKHEEQVTTNEQGEETHPSWGMISASRVQNSHGAVVFDSDIKHQTTMRVRVSTAVRHRDLSRDWLGSRQEFLEVEMSEAQWASFVSSVNTSGVPCSIRRREGDLSVPSEPYEPRLQESMEEVRGAADEALAKVRKAFDAYKEHKVVANLRTLEAAINNAAPNVEFAAKSLNEHAENVVQKARADIEAMVTTEAHRRGLDPGDLGGVNELTAGKDDTT